MLKKGRGLAESSPFFLTLSVVYCLAGGVTVTIYGGQLTNLHERSRIGANYTADERT